MVVQQNHRRGVGQDHRLEDLTRVDERRGQRSDGHDVEADHPVLPVEEERDEHLAVELAELLTEGLVDLGGVADPSDGPVALPALPDDLELVHLRSPFSGRRTRSRREKRKGPQTCAWGPWLDPREPGGFVSRAGSRTRVYRRWPSMFLSNSPDTAGRRTFSPPFGGVYRAHPSHLVFSHWSGSHRARRMDRLP